MLLFLLWVAKEESIVLLCDHDSRHSGGVSDVRAIVHDATNDDDVVAIAIAVVGRQELPLKVKALASAFSQVCLSLCVSFFGLFLLTDAAAVATAVSDTVTGASDPSWTSVAIWIILLKCRIQSLILTMNDDCSYLFSLFTL
jgi:hypothetical protein